MKNPLQTYRGLSDALKELKPGYILSVHRNNKWVEICTMEEEDDLDRLCIGDFYPLTLSEVMESLYCVEDL